LVHDGEFLERCGFEVPDGDELGVSLDGGLGEDDTTFGGDNLARVILHCDSLIDAICQM